MKVHISYAAQTAGACCTLHNFCILNGEEEPLHNRSDPHLLESDERSYFMTTTLEKRLDTKAKLIRLAVYLVWRAGRINQRAMCDAENQG